MTLIKPWIYTEEYPCPTCYSWIPKNSPCNHKKYICPTCGREQCVLHWPYPMKSEREAIHFLKSAEEKTGKRCFVREVHFGRFVKYKIFTSEEDYRNYIQTRKHKR